MTVSETAIPALKFQKADCVDGETGRLFAAFYSIHNDIIREKVINILMDIHNDEDAADEILNLAARALRRPDLYGGA